MSPVPCTLLLLTLLTSPVTPWSTGAPVSTCKSLYPVHGANAQYSASPYVISSDKTTIFSNESVIVTIDGTLFKGFVMMAKPTESWQQRWQQSIGRFHNGFHLNVFDCDGMMHNAVSHAFGHYNKDVKIKWMPPPHFEGRITFVATVMKSYKVFWAKQPSPPVTIVRLTRWWRYALSLQPVKGHVPLKVSWRLDPNCLHVRSTRTKILPEVKVRCGRDLDGKDVEVDMAWSTIWEAERSSVLVSLINQSD